MISGAGHGQGISGKLLHFQAPFWSDIASAFPLVVLVSRLAALWRLRVRGECRRGPGGVLCGDADQPRLGISGTICCMGTWARMPRLLGSLFNRTRRTRLRGRARVPGCLYGTAKTHTPFPRADPGPTFSLFPLLFFLTFPGCERKSAVSRRDRVSHGTSFCAPGSLARRRLQG